MRHRIGLLAAVLAVVMTMGASSAAIASAPGGAVTAKPQECVEMKKIVAKLPPQKAKAIFAACEAKKLQKTGAPGEAHGKKDTMLADLAKRFGVGEKSLVKALTELKLALAKNCGDPSDPALVKGFASNLGVSPAKAKAILAALLGENSKPGKSGKHCELGSPAKPGDPGKRADAGKPDDLDKSGNLVKKMNG